MSKYKGLVSIDIFKERVDGASINQLARKYGVAPTTIVYHYNKVKKLAEDKDGNAQSKG
jgi:AcrR family transcriptional regulator